MIFCPSRSAKKISTGQSFLRGKEGLRWKKKKTAFDAHDVPASAGSRLAFSGVFCSNQHILLIYAGFTPKPSPST